MLIDKPYLEYLQKNTKECSQVFDCQQAIDNHKWFAL